ncbi:MAG TPA: hypothetical protein VMF29_03795 [Candidatus Edwardsbacteria bacterium]|nr:hypothetical protein [Candidatus Edwardsbacteria bacterium]
MNMELLITCCWTLILSGVLAVLGFPASREAFVAATRAHPYLMGMAKFALLGTMGELLSWKVVSGRWKLSGVRLWQRALVWAVIGVMLTIAFPLFSAGVDGLLAQGYLPGLGIAWLAAFWKSLFLQAVFAFPFMTFHRITDTLIERGRLFSKWPLIEVYKGIDWDNMFKVVGMSIILFWLPVHTVNFMLPPEFRVIVAALLAIVLGLILGFAKRKSVKNAVA